MTKLEQYYNKFHEEHRLTTRHGIVEFTTTMKVIEEAVEILRGTMGTTLVDNGDNPLKIADIGAGTGIYSVELCHRGYDVTAVEIE